MRVLYRGLAVVAAVVAAAATLTVVLPAQPDEVVAGPVTAPSVAPTSSGSVPSVPPPALSAAPTAAPPAVATPKATPSGRSSLAPGYTAMEALYADRRVPRLTGAVKRMRLPKPSRRVIKDTRVGLAVPRLAGPWKAYGPAPFTTKQVLPKTRGSSLRGIFVSCPLPIMAQRSARDTALLAARWTLNHHPKGARIGWLASQPVKDGWMLVYRVTYGKRTSRAAVVIMDGGMSKPGLVFVSVPDSQRKQWRDIGRVVSGVRVLG
ncbi:hypothetical protein [Nonomuraea sp. NPDC002799]